MAKICAKCKKNVYPLEELKCLDKIWHKSCFRCTTCNMLLNMKNYKGHDKLPYCVAHYPKTKATSVAMTPEISRITNNTKLQSQVHYHEDFEKKIKGSKIEVTDDPETARVLKVNAMISQTNYKSSKPQPPLSKPRVMERVKAQDQPSPMSARCVTNSVVYTSDGSRAVGGSRTQGGRKVGSIADYDPVNNQYGSISHAPQGALRTPHKGGVVEKGVIEEHVNGGKNGEMEKSKRANEDGVEGGVGMLIRRVEEEEEEERGIKVREEEKKREKEKEEEERKTEQRKEDEKRRVEEEEEEERRVKDEERRKKEEQEQKEEKRRVKEKEEKERKMKEEEEEEKMREKEEERKRLEEEERRENEEAEMKKMVEERRKKEEEERKEKEEEERRKKEEERRKEEGGMKENGYLEQRQGLKPDLLPMERHSQEELNQQQQQRYLEQQQLEQQQLEQQQLEQQQLEQQQLEQQQLEQQQLEQQQLEQQQLEQQQQLLEEQKKLQQQQQLYEAAVEQQQQQHGEEGDDDDEVREEQQPVVIDDDEIATTPLPGVWQALYDFTAQDDDEVSFVEDDVITQVERIDDGWFLGTVERTKLRGMLPSNYVEMRQ